MKPPLTVHALAVEISRLDLAVDLLGRKLQAAVARLDQFDAFIDGAARRDACRPRKEGK